jgi:hypothetical protein
MGWKSKRPTKMENQQGFTCLNKKFLSFVPFLSLVLSLQNSVIPRDERTKGTKRHKYSTKEKKIKVSK